jgi:hypothetical protein
LGCRATSSSVIAIEDTDEEEEVRIIDTADEGDTKKKNERKVK